MFTFLYWNIIYKEKLKATHKCDHGILRITFILTLPATPNHLSKNLLKCQGPVPAILVPMHMLTHTHRHTHFWGYLSVRILPLSCELLAVTTSCPAIGLYRAGSVWWFYVLWLWVPPSSIDSAFVSSAPQAVCCSSEFLLQPSRAYPHIWSLSLLPNKTILTTSHFITFTFTSHIL